MSTTVKAVPMPDAGAPDYVLTLSCTDEIGIVNAVSAFLVDKKCNILDSAQFLDRSSNTFFMRVAFRCYGATLPQDLEQEFEAVARPFGMMASVHDVRIKKRVLIMVSKSGHCLNDLLYRYDSGSLNIDIPLIVSNHPDLSRMAAAHNIPFHHLPVSSATKASQETKLLELVEREQIDLVVLARYMQILSSDLCRALEGRAINIHHSFLPSFKGARPYHQAQARGVKLIGATAHYVTTDLDEGPIIEQDVARVDHALDPELLTAIGRDVEASVLSRAVRLHVENRILMNGHRTVVFR